MQWNGSSGKGSGKNYGKGSSGSKGSGKGSSAHGKGSFGHEQRSRSSQDSRYAAPRGEMTWDNWRPGR